MNCFCPKCNVEIEIALQEISAKATSHQCPECNGKYWTVREAYSLRSYSKQGSIYCVECGQELGVSDVCVQCGSLYPDYCVVQSAKPVVRKQQGSGFSLGLSLGGTRTVVPQAVIVDDKPARHFNARPLIYVAAAVLLVVLAVGLGKYYLVDQGQQKFSKDFVVALYGIKSGTDLSLKKCAAITSEWQGKSGPGRAIAPRLSQKELDDLGKVRDEIDKTLKALENPPEEFITANEKLTRLYQIYEQLYDLSTGPPASLTGFSTSAQKLEADFLKAAHDLKASLPEPLENELRTAVAKYRNLRFLVEKA